TRLPTPGCSAGAGAPAPICSLPVTSAAVAGPGAGIRPNWLLVPSKAPGHAASAPVPASRRPRVWPWEHQPPASSAGPAGDGAGAGAGAGAASSTAGAAPIGAAATLTAPVIEAASTAAANTRPALRPALLPLMASPYPRRSRVSMQNLRRYG